ncbi:MAG: metallophosphoesterase family protein [Desulfovibrionales bacterium]
MTVHIAVVSDTHISQPSKELVEVFDRFFLRADMVLHCGDITGEDTLALFLTHPRFVGVTGNMDAPSVSGSLPVRRIIHIQGWRVGIIHGWGRGGLVPAAVRASFEGECDLVCFGHTHRRLWDASGVPMLLNPGSLMLPRQGNRGFANLTLEKGRPPEVRFQDI